MPKQPVELELDEQTKAALDAICDQQGLETREQAVEWLLRRRMRKGAYSLVGRGRALYPIDGGRR